MAPLGLAFSRSALLLTFRDSACISSYQLRHKTLRHCNTTRLELEHIKQIDRVYASSITN